MSRQDTFKTSLSVIKFRFFTTMWMLFGVPMFWFLWPSSLETTWDFYSQLASIWFGCWLGMHGITWFMSFGMYTWGALVNNHPAYQQWLAAGGHPFWDTLYFFNNDPPQVRAAIGIPPQYPFCFNCGASLTGLAGLGSNYGNVCPNCGACNDTFAEGDCRPASFLG